MSPFQRKWIERKNEPDMNQPVRGLWHLNTLVKEKKKKKEKTNKQTTTTKKKRCFQM